MTVNEKTDTKINLSLNGIVNVNKPLGITSHDVVYRLRKILNIKKIGHTGTLDPDASGVLPICIGRATKTADMLTASDKQYIAEVTTGAATDTLDASGTVTETSDITVTEEEIKNVLGEFIGDIKQIPPMYSAIKVDGKRLYTLARDGVEIEREPRDVHIEKIELLKFMPENNRFVIKVDCSKGTYIRSLCDDIGRRLGCLAHMSALERTRSGRFGIEDSYTIEEIAEMTENGDYSFLTPIDEVFGEFPKLIISNRKARIMCNGTRISTQGTDEGVTYRVYDEAGNFLTISRAENGVLVILKTFYQSIENGGANK